MDIRQLFEKILTDFDNTWFQAALLKFKNHPSNPDHADSFFVSIEQPLQNDMWDYLPKRIELKDFLFGVRDDQSDDLHDEMQENDHTETIGVDDDGRPIIDLIEGHTFTPASTFYPENDLAKWLRAIKEEIKACLRLLSSLKEKDIFFDFVARECRAYKGQLANLQLDQTHLHCLIMVLDEVLDLVRSQSERLTVLQTIILENEERLPFNLTAAQLAKLILLLVEKDFVDIPKDNITKFFERYATVKYSGKDVVPKTLSSAFRRLNSANKSAINKAWAASIKLDL